jgi:hypothetical protein
LAFYALNKKSPPPNATLPFWPHFLKQETFLPISNLPFAKTCLIKAQRPGSQLSNTATLGAHVLAQ